MSDFLPVEVGSRVCRVLGLCESCSVFINK